MIQQNTTTRTDLALLIGRVGIAALMLTHGIPKLMQLFSGEPISFPSVMGMSGTVSLVLAVLTEVLGSLFLLGGLATRYAAAALAITMAVAAFYIHGADPFAKQEKSILYLLFYIVLFFTGSGRYSLDQYLKKSKVS